MLSARRSRHLSVPCRFLTKPHRRSSKYDAGQEIRTGTPESSDVISVEVLKLHARERITGTGCDGRGVFSNAEHLRTLSEERRDGKKSRDVAYKSRLMGLVRDLQDTDKPPLLLSKITGAWLIVHGTTVSGTVLSATESWNFLFAHYNVSPVNL